MGCLPRLAMGLPCLLHTLPNLFNWNRFPLDLFNELLGQSFQVNVLGRLLKRNCHQPLVLVELRPRIGADIPCLLPWRGREFNVQ